MDRQNHETGCTMIEEFHSTVIDLDFQDYQYACLYGMAGAPPSREG